MAINPVGVLPPHTCGTSLVLWEETGAAETASVTDTQCLTVCGREAALEIIYKYPIPLRDLYPYVDRGISEVLACQRRVKCQDHALCVCVSRSMLASLSTCGCLSRLVSAVGVLGVGGLSGNPQRSPFARRPGLAREYQPAICFSMR